MYRHFGSLTLRRWAFWLCLLAVLTLALLPPSRFVPTTVWDKANHVFAFAVLAVLGCAAYRGRTAKVLLGLLVYGAAIEVLQALTPYRWGEAADVVADGMGLLLGWQLGRLLRQRGASRG